MRTLNLLVLITCLVIGLFSPPTYAAVEAGVGGSCSGVVMTLTRRWLDVKNHMLPIGKELSRPEEADFVCRDPAYLQNAVERRLATSADIRCYSPRLGGGLGICCDSRLFACAQLHPQKYSDEPQRARQEPATPKSIWVAPPSESDQWKSN